MDFPVKNPFLYESNAFFENFRFLIRRSLRLRSLMVRMKCFLFDIDGTLIHSHSDHNRFYRETIREILGLDPEKIPWEMFTNITDDGVVQDVHKHHFQKEIEDEKFSIFKERFTEKIRSSVEKDSSLYPEISGAKKFLESLEMKKLPLGIITGSWLIPARVKTKNAKIPIERFPISSSEDAQNRNGIILKTLEKLKSVHSVEDFSEVVYFGDGLWDWRASQELGLRFIGINSMENDLLKKNGVPTVFQDYTEPEKIFQEIGVL
ncbi:HAD family hydrolase [Leptospira adleri]|uniref:HAD family hydrolase n=1 Tax=Leptospira adleri TaxID=2023186 RepID=UPI0010838C4D|nr:HAD family hydrolase [Leptospira adleri]TGM58306.1 HAD family hydrolase [Leptospira adleri]